MSEPPMVTWVSHPNPVVIALLVILGLVILGIAVMCVWLWRTRDTGSHSAGRERHPLQAVSGWVSAAVTWWIDGRRTSPARIPPAENPDPARPHPHHRPFADWLNDSTVDAFQAIKLTKGGE